MAKTKLTSGQLAALAELPGLPTKTGAELKQLRALAVPDEAKPLLGTWQSVHDGLSYELLFLDGMLQMRRLPDGTPYEKKPKDFERLLAFGCFVR
ncbi:hypothetical protein Q5H92_26430 [Hymenobacter sp. M29]|uniref:Uncharacterized protein n=1 Tax=Hymenobacter mellowenesis TaxID=3063995 RepID=A0ABT9AJ98_9BACT|nr:hypothetical protein [Hymenobacter sp. M29]MDO7849924.1 hypothetical protein [Hymenobacter sp. M29]